jgi:hopene-associated glycosyltransferase HpnB
MIALTLVSALSLVIWAGLLLFWGRFHRADQRLPERAAFPTPEVPALTVVIPARNEASLLPRTLGSLLAQDYPGRFDVILVDDHSDDGTGDIARTTAAERGMAHHLEVLHAADLPSGWTGKLWALDQGVTRALGRPAPPDYLLLTDADIEHAPDSLRRLAAKAATDGLELASLMALLRCNSAWERLLIPAFIFFFQKLYPFPWVNDPCRSVSAAAGGCILVKREAMARIGGVGAVRDALIDDCALARAVKLGDDTAHPRPIWLGLTRAVRSLRAYPRLRPIWEMVARTAYTQLRYSPLLLAGTVMGMLLLYVVPPVATLWGLLGGMWGALACGAAAWALMAAAYLPTLRLYRRPALQSLTLPFAGALYTLMTLDSARRHWQGRGGSWKGRTYARPE